jgi:hypothetical protein
MPPWLIFSIFGILFLGTGFIGTWVIREGGSIAFLWPSFLKKKSGKVDRRN